MLPTLHSVVGHPIINVIGVCESAYVLLLSSATRWPLLVVVEAVAARLAHAVLAFLELALDRHDLLDRAVCVGHAARLTVSALAEDQVLALELALRHKLVQEAHAGCGLHSLVLGACCFLRLTLALTLRAGRLCALPLRLQRGVATAKGAA